MITPSFEVYFILKTILIAQIDKTQRTKGNLKNCIQTKKKINEDIDKNEAKKKKRNVGAKTVITKFRILLERLNRFEQAKQRKNQ